MTIKELKAILNTFDDDSKDAFVVLFKNDRTAIEYEISSISDNNGHLQIDIEEE